MPRRRLCRVDRPASKLLRPLPLSAAIALWLFASGCNLLLDNDKRVLRGLNVEPPEAGEPDSGATPAPDAGPDTGSATPGGGNPDSGEPDAGRIPAGCPSDGLLPQCSPGDVDEDEEVCGMCDRGRMTRERRCNADCTWGEWTSSGKCLEFPDVCVPGTIDEMPTGPCGDCNTGTGKRTRTCTIACGWSDWSPVVCTPDPMSCKPDTVETLEPVACAGMCSSRTPSRKCNAQCKWDAPNPGQCTGQGVCAPGATRMTTVGCNPNFCNKGEQQQMETCSASCMWGSPVAMGACRIPSNVCRPVDLGGTRNWRCRPNDPGYREYCHPGTASEEDRCTWNGARERYDGPC